MSQSRSVKAMVKLLVSLYFFFLSIIFLPVFLPGSFIREASLPKISLIAELTDRKSVV